jgi:hypothetical protein
MIPIIYSNLWMDKSSAGRMPAVSTFVQIMGTNVQNRAKTGGFMDKVALNTFLKMEKQPFLSSLPLTTLDRI